jgi:multidrug resistance efflux pump
VPQEQATRDRERDVRIERLHAQIAALAAQRRMSAATVQRLEYEIDRRTVRASVDGIIGEAAPLRRGAVVQEAENLASIVPAGRLVVAAQFPAGAALGRIRPGQAATLRLDGFPWAEFGAVSATVANVAREIREGTVRVELTIEPGSGFRGTLEHGMPGSAEVAVERVTPLSLLLRTAGEGLTVRR